MIRPEASLQCPQDHFEESNARRGLRPQLCGHAWLWTCPPHSRQAQSPLLHSLPCAAYLEWFWSCCHRHLLYRIGCTVRSCFPAYPAFICSLSSLHRLSPCKCWPVYGAFSLHGGSCQFQTRVRFVIHKRCLMALRKTANPVLSLQRAISMHRAMQGFSAHKLVWDCPGRSGSVFGNWLDAGPVVWGLPGSVGRIQPAVLCCSSSSNPTGPHRFLAARQ